MANKLHQVLLLVLVITGDSSRTLEVSTRNMSSSDMAEYTSLEPNAGGNKVGYLDHFIHTMERLEKRGMTWSNLSTSSLECSEKWAQSLINSFIGRDNGTLEDPANETDTMETGYLQDAKCLQNGLKDVIGGQVTDGTVRIADKTPLTGQNMRALKQGVKSDHTGREDPRASKVASSGHSVKDGLLENDLSFTCRGRCGLKISFPCGCSASCVVYQRCCKDMAVDCPHVAQEGRPMLQRFLNVDLFCDDDHVFKINSCPQGTEKDLEQNGNDSKDEDKNVHQLTDLQPSSVWPEVSRTVLETIEHTETSRHVPWCRGSG